MMTLDDLRCPACGSPLRDCRFDVCRACGEQGVFASGVTGAAPIWYRRYTGGWVSRYVRTLAGMAVNARRFFSAFREVPLGTGATLRWFGATVLFWTVTLLVLTVGFDVLQFGLLWGQSKAALIIPPPDGFANRFADLQAEVTATLSHGWIVFAGQWCLGGFILWVIAGASFAERDLEEVFSLAAMLGGVELLVLIATAGWKYIDRISFQASGQPLMGYLPIVALSARACAGAILFVAMRRTYLIEKLSAGTGLLIYWGGSVALMWKVGLPGYGWDYPIDWPGF